MLNEYISSEGRWELQVRWKYLWILLNWKSFSCVRLFGTPWIVVHGILQVRILECVAFPFSRGSSQPRAQTLVDSLPAEPQGKPSNSGVGRLSLLQQIFSNQESNWGLLHCRRILYQLSYQGSPFQVILTSHGLFQRNEKGERHILQIWYNLSTHNLTKILLEKNFSWQFLL